MNYSEILTRRAYRLVKARNEARPEHTLSAHMQVVIAYGDAIAEAGADILTCNITRLSASDDHQGANITWLPNSQIITFFICSALPLPGGRVEYTSMIRRRVHPTRERQKLIDETQAYLERGVAKRQAPDGLLNELNTASAVVGDSHQQMVIRF
ncbi:MAG: hypothetical protein V3T17_02945 [Pseudomonadales bacterium]